MRTPQLWMAAASVGLALMGGLAGCAGADGNDGATGPQGAKGDQGAQGADGTKGDQGANGAKGDKGEPGADGSDGTCAARAPLAITGVTGNEGAVFPGEASHVRVMFQGAVTSATFQFIGATTLLGGGVSFANAPERGDAFNEWLFTSDAEADTEYVVIATDGCSMATYKFTVRTRAAYVSWIHAASEVGGLGVRKSGDTHPLTFSQVMCDPLYSCQTQESTTLFAGDSSLFVGVAAREATYDLLDATGDIVTTTPKLTFAPGVHYQVILHPSVGNPLDVTVFEESAAALQDPTHRARFSFANLLLGSTSVDVKLGTTPAFEDVAFGELAAELPEIVPANFVFNLDIGTTAPPDGTIDATLDGMRGKIRNSDIFNGTPLWVDKSLKDFIVPGDRVTVFVYDGPLAEGGLPRLLISDWDLQSGKVYQLGVETAPVPDVSGTQAPAEPLAIPDLVVVQTPTVACDAGHNVPCGVGACCGAPSSCSFDANAARVCARTTQTPLTSTITIAAPVGCDAVATIDLNVQVQHAVPLDLDYALQSPSGAEFVFIGYTADELAIFEGIDDFKNEAPSGVWTLEITDTRSEYAGALVSWTLGVHCLD